ncbi:MAG: hypothetical protein QW356_02140 [Candidatus Hadarchaeales archaeon]
MPTEEELINWGTEIGALAASRRTAKDQLEKLIASLESVSDPRLALLVTAAYAIRQSRREKAPLTQDVAQLIASILHRLYEANGTKTEARKVLGFAKWVREASDIPALHGKQVKTLKDFVGLVAGR